MRIEHARLDRKGPPRRVRFDLAFLRTIAGATLLAVSLSAAAAALLDDLIAAVTNDRVDEVKALLARGMDPDSVDRNGEPMLCIAARNGYVATVTALLTAHAKVDLPNAFGDTPLMLAALERQP